MRAGGDGPTTSGELAGALLGAPHRFGGRWLDEDAKTVVAVPSSWPPDERLTARISAGAREAGADHVLAGQAGERHAAEDLIEVRVPEAGPLAGLPRPDGDLLLALPGLSGAVLVTGQGYALVAGDARFVRACLDTGIDEARARFARYARRLAGSRPEMLAVSEEFPPRHPPASTPAEVAPGSGVAEQLSLMGALARGELPAAAFAPAWLAAHRRALTGGERVRDALERALLDVFYALEDYAADPSLREPGDLSDEELTSRVRASLGALVPPGGS
ncbi:hypothetical protein [Streptosporangium subroseum]|uniref:hypothetical protein n=1 Tax=Streptosporangium subroseum TaxID=106412 RepID=UPI00308BE2C3|nr:hypothetical protein OHB15_16730 [Streptosporangium subroseum]